MVIAFFFLSCHVMTQNSGLRLIEMCQARDAHGETSNPMAEVPLFVSIYLMFARHTASSILYNL